MPTNQNLRQTNKPYNFPTKLITLACGYRDTFDVAITKDIPLVCVSGTKRASGGDEGVFGQSSKLLDHKLCGSFLGSFHTNAVAKRNIKRSYKLLKKSLWLKDNSIGAVKSLNPGTNDFQNLRLQGLNPSYQIDSIAELNLAQTSMRLRNSYPMMVLGLNPKLQIALPILELPFDSKQLVVTNGFVSCNITAPRCYSHVTSFFDPKYIHDPQIPSRWTHGIMIPPDSESKCRFRSVVLAKFFRGFGGRPLCQTFSLTFNAENGDLASLIVDYADLHWHYFTTGFVEGVAGIRQQLNRCS